MGACKQGLEWRWQGGGELQRWGDRNVQEGLHGRWSSGHPWGCYLGQVRGLQRAQGLREPVLLLTACTRTQAATGNSCVRPDLCAPRPGSNLQPTLQPTDSRPAARRPSVRPPASPALGGGFRVLCVRSAASPTTLKTGVFSVEAAVCRQGFVPLHVCSCLGEALGVWAGTPAPCAEPRARARPGVPSDRIVGTSVPLSPF